MSGRHKVKGRRAKDVAPDPKDVFSSPSERRRHRLGSKKPTGPRRAKLKSRRRSRLRKQGLAGVGMTAVASLLAIGLVAITVRQVTRPDPEPSPTSLAGDGTLTTTLVFGTKEGQGGEAGGATWLALLYLDKAEPNGGVVYLPAHVATEIPGRGLHPLGDALATGGLPLLLVSTENLLGIQIDRYIELSDRDAEVLFEETGPITIDVPSDVRVKAGPDQAQLLFAEGLQTLDASFLMRYLYTLGLEDTDIELGARHLTFWAGFWKHFQTQVASLGDAIEGAGAALSETDASIKDHVTFFEDLASLEPHQLQVGILPVTQMSVGGEELYQALPDELSTFVAETIGQDPDQPHETRVQILNGNGVPGIGQEVADRLIGKGFRVILSGNASRLNYRKTLIVTYDSSPAGMALAEKARELLGVGEVQVSIQEQGIVDLTIVVGRDFVRQA